MNFLAKLNEKQQLVLLFLIALITRSIALPFSHIVPADATSRLFIAEHLRTHGGEISSLQWQSLHIYFLAFGQLIFGERYIGPTILTMLLAAGAVIPFYLYTSRVFIKEGAFASSLLFIFCPIVFQSSFTCMSEIFYTFFTLFALWALSEGVLSTKKIKWSILAGLFITVACGARFEPWLIALLLGIILLILKEWRMFLIFGAMASIFPLYWLIFSKIKTGHYFASLDMIAYQNFVVGNGNNSETLEVLRRTIFFPLSYIIVLFPPVAIMLFFFLFKIVFKIRTQLVRALFSSVFICMFIFSVNQARGGMLATQHRYVITLIMLSLPFWSIWFQNKKHIITKTIVSIIISLILIPWSFMWQNIGWHRIAGSNNNLHNTLAKIISGTYNETQAIPRIPEDDFIYLSDAMNEVIKPSDGIFITWCGWAQSFFLAHRAKTSKDNIWILCEENPVPLNYQGINNFYNSHHQGLIVISDLNYFTTKIKLYGSLLQMDNVPGGIILEPICYSNHYRLFRYNWIDEEEAKVIKNKNTNIKPLYTFEKDQKWFEITAYNHDGNWLSGIWQEAVKQQRSLKEQVAIEALKKVNEKNKSDTLR